MRKVIITFFTLVVVSILTSFSLDKPFCSMVTYYYKPATANQRLQSGINGGTLIERSINAPGSVFCNTSSWQTGAIVFTPTADMSKYIGSITFCEEATPDGASDCALTLAEALSIVCATYIANGNVMPSCVQIGFCSCITVVAKTVANP